MGERLKSQIEQDQKAIEDQTQAALTAHASALKKLSSDALNTTKSAIQSESKTLLQSIEDAQLLTSGQAERLRRLSLTLTLWPILATAAACLLMIGLTWLYLPTELFTAKTETWTLGGGKQATVIISQDWTICRDQQQTPRPCKIITRN